MQVLKTTLIAALLALAPVLAQAADGCDSWLECESISQQIKANSCRVTELERHHSGDIFLDSTICSYGDYRPLDYSCCSNSCDSSYGSHVYGAIGYELRYTDYGVEGNFDQRLRFAVNYFSQLSDNLSLHFGVSDRFDGLPNSDPFGFQQDIREIQRDMRFDRAYVHYDD